MTPEMKTRFLSLIHRSSLSPFNQLQVQILELHSNLLASTLKGSGWGELKLLVIEGLVAKLSYVKFLADSWFC